jgi:hypothetical protein
MTHKKSKQICELLNVRYIDFSIPENFIDLLDLIFTFHHKFHLSIAHRIAGFMEDTLMVLIEELEEAKYETPLKVKEFANRVKAFNWYSNANE